MKSAYALSALVAAGTVAAAPSEKRVVPGPIHVPVVRRSPPTGSMLQKYGGVAQSARNRYGYHAAHQRVRKRQAGQSAGIDIINQNSDSSYLGTISIGTPAQSLNVVLDTGSSDLWVAGTSCSRCPSIPTFDTGKSSSFQQSSNAQDIQINYGSGSVAGSLASETVSLGGFTVAQQPFLVVDQMTSGLLDGQVSGILGLAFQPLASTRATPFWQTLADNNQLATAEMGFYLNRELDNPNAGELEYGGVFTLGGTNSSLYQGDIEFINLPSNISPSFWLLEVSSVTVQGKNVNIATGNNALAAIDTGTTLIGGPSDDVAAIWAQVPGAKAANESDLEGFYTFPCDTEVNAAFAFGGKSWAISTTDMNLGQISRNGPCLGGIFDLNLGSSISEGSGNPNWVVGDVFLKNVYSVYRYSPAAVGFAQLANGENLPSSGGNSATRSATITASSGAPGLPTSRSSGVTVTGAGSAVSATPTGSGNDNAAGTLHPSAFVGALCVALSMLFT